MECKEVQKRYIPFIDDCLSIKELQEFLQHMKECPDCKEEYDIYYTMLMSVRYLEDDNLKGTDWVDSDSKIEFAQEYLDSYRLRQVVKYAILIGICIGYAWIIS